MVGLPPHESERVQAVREALPSTQAGILLNTAAAGPLPVEAARAMHELAGTELRLGRSDEATAEADLQRLEEARATLAAIVGGAIDELTVTHGGIAALDVALEDLLPLAPGPRGRLVTTDQQGELMGALETWAKRHGWSLVAVPARGEDDDAFLEAARSALEPDRPGPRAIVVSHVLPTTGRRLPLERLTELAASLGAVTIAEGSLAVGAVPVVAPELGVAAYAFGGQAWLLGPRGTGGLWLANGRRTPPSTGIVHRPEMSGPAVVGLARSVGWLAMEVGLPWAFERGARLTARLREGLATIPGLALLTPASARQAATTLTLQLSSWGPRELLEALADRAFVLAAPVASLGAVRLSVGFFNTEEELDRVVLAVREIASHRPETLPRRPRLTIVHEPGSGT